MLVAPPCSASSAPLLLARAVPRLAPPQLALLALPTATSGSVWAVAAVSGGAAVAAQLGLVALLRRAKGRPWLSESPGFVAHQAIALVFMAIATAVGAAAWLSPAGWALEPAARFLTPDGTTRFLAAMLFGELVLWDLPCAIWIKQLRRPDSLLHHFAMAAVAFNAMALAPIYYGVFYLGLIEASTLPLNAHEYFAHAARTLESLQPGALPGAERLLRRFRALRDGFQAAAAASFVAVRGVLFTAVSLRRFYPEVAPLLASPAAARLRGPLWGHAVSVGAFNALQLYWLGLLVAYTVRNGVGGERPD